MRPEDAVSFFWMKFYIYAKAYEHDRTPSPTTELEVYSYMLATHLFFSTSVGNFHNHLAYASQQRVEI